VGQNLVNSRLDVSSLLRLAGGAGIAVVVFSLIVNLLMLTGPLFMLQIYDRVLTSGSIPTLVALAGLVVLLYALYGFLEFVRSRIMVRVAGSIDADVRDRAFDAVTFHAVKGEKSVRTMPLTDLAHVRQFLSGPGPFAFLDTPWTPIYLLFIYLMHPVLGIASVIAVAILASLAVINNLLTRKASAEASKIAGRANAAGEEARRNAEVTTALGMGPMLRARWARIQEQALEEQMTASDRGGAITALSRTMRFMFQSGILGLGAWLAVQQEISPGTMIAASIIMARALAPVEQMVAHWQGYLTFREAWGRLSKVLKTLPEHKDGVSLPDPAGHVEVENLTAGLPQMQRPMLMNISFELTPGEGLGIIGPTGAGKTTLARILVGAWPHYRGVVRLGGAELAQYPEDQLGRSVGYLPQDVELYDGTIGENICRFQSDAKANDIIEAAKQADVHSLILSFPDGYETMIGEGGAMLSAGQRQRIGLARALYGNPSLIVLDEPNANLDAAGEKAVITAVNSARDNGSTVIVIAHRPSAIASLDTLMMLRDGRCVAIGPKDEVLDKVIQRTPAPAAPPRPAPGFQSMGMSLSSKPDEAAE
jgi:PrtD family type I secretion system ABC transporter